MANVEDTQKKVEFKNNRALCLCVGVMFDRKEKREEEMECGKKMD